MVEPGAPGQVSKDRGVPKQAGVPRGQGVPKGAGRPPELGMPRERAVLPGTPGTRRPGEPGQVARGAEGQLDKTAPNPWAPTPDTVIADEADLLLPPSSPDRVDPAPSGPDQPS